ncbi:uncharacterized, partial [Tachysurus ichikawai]
GLSLPGVPMPGSRSALPSTDTPYCHNLAFLPG